MVYRPMLLSLRGMYSEVLLCFVMITQGSSLTDTCVPVPGQLSTAEDKPKTTGLHSGRAAQSQAESRSILLQVDHLKLRVFWQIP